MKTTASPPPGKTVTRRTARTQVMPEKAASGASPAGGGGGRGAAGRWKPGPALLVGIVVCTFFLGLRAVSGRVTNLTWLSDAVLFDLFSAWGLVQDRTGPLPLVVVRYEAEALRRRGLGLDEEAVLHRELIEKLKPLGPKVIGFDGNVSSFRDDERTRALLELLQEEPKVVLASELLPPEQTGTILNPQVEKTADRFAGLVTGFANFQAGERTDQHLNRGGTIRSTLLSHGGKRSFADMLFARYLGIEAGAIERGVRQVRYGDRTVPLTDGRMLIAYSNPASFPSISYDDLLTDKGEIPTVIRKLIRDKVVVIGSFIEAHRDTHMTPLGRLAGVLVHAQILENLLSSRHMSRVPPWVGYLLVVLACAVAEGARRRLPGRAVIFVSWGLAAAGLVATGVLFLQGIWLTSFHALLALATLGVVHGMLGREAVRGARGNSVLSWLSGVHTVEVSMEKGDLTYNLALQVVDPRYEQLDMLGKGGMGIVLSGVDSQTGREVAIKLLSPMLLDRGDLVKRFLREIETLRKLKHPGVIEIYETYPEAQVPYYVMERVHGRDLATRWADGEELSRARVRDLFGQLFDALSYVHRQGFVHRDIKPENIMITDDFRLKMLDFGLAYFSEASTLTSDGQILGTLKYMSPEQLHAEPIHAPSDIFSAGIVLYETLSGKLPYPQVSHVLNFEAPYRPLSSMGVTVPPKLEALVAWCLKVKPAERPASCEEVLERWKLSFEEE